MSEEQNPTKQNTTRLDVLIVVAVTLIVIIALLATLLRVGGGDDSQSAPSIVSGATATTAAPVAPIAPIAQPAVPLYPVADEIDQEVENWHNGAMPYFFRLTSTLGLPPAEGLGVIGTRCVNIGLMVEDLRAYDQAPREDLGDAIDTWLAAVDNAVDYCVDESHSDPEDIRKHNIFLSFEESARLWGDVMASLASYGISLQR